MIGRQVVAAVALGAVVANAQSFGGLSQGCTTAATSIITGPFAACAELTSLVSVVTGGTPIVTGLNNYLSQVCPAAPCNSTVTSDAASTIQSGCQSDISGGNQLAGVLYTVVSNYTTVRNGLCTRATSNSTYCVTNLLSSVQQSTRTNITVNSLIGLLSGGGFSNFSIVYGVRKSHTELAPLAQRAGASAASSASSAVSSTCGASFVNGQLPSSVAIQSGASDASASGSGSAAGASGSSVTSRTGAAGVSVAPLVGMLGAVVVAGFGALLVL